MGSAVDPVALAAGWRCVVRNATASYGSPGPVARRHCPAPLRRWRRLTAPPRCLVLSCSSFKRGAGWPALATLPPAERLRRHVEESRQHAGGRSGKRFANGIWSGMGDKSAGRDLGDRPHRGSRRTAVRRGAGVNRRSGPSSYFETANPFAQEHAVALRLRRCAKLTQHITSAVGGRSNSIQDGTHRRGCRVAPARRH